MKNQNIFRRGQYAWSGIRASWKSEKSFRCQVIVCCAVIVLLLVTRPPAIWWAVMLLTTAAMMAVELINTAVEKLIDHLHPDQHEVIGVVKDTLSGAVQVMCAAGVVVLIAFTWQYIK